MHSLVNCEIEFKMFNRNKIVEKGQEQTAKKTLFGAQKIQE